MTRIIFALLLLLSSWRTFAQEDQKRLPLYMAYLPKVQYELAPIQSISLAVGNINYLGDDIVPIPVFYHGPYADCGLGFKNNNLYMTNKIGYECFVFFLGGRLNLVHYTNFSNNQFCLRPEVGLTLFSVATITYGYNFNLSNKDCLGAKGNVLSINLAYFFNKKPYRGH